MFCGKNKHILLQAVLPQAFLADKLNKNNLKKNLSTDLLEKNCTVWKESEFYIKKNR